MASKDKAVFVSVLPGDVRAGLVAEVTAGALDGVKLAAATGKVDRRFALAGLAIVNAIVPADAAVAERNDATWNIVRAEIDAIFSDARDRIVARLLPATALKYGFRQPNAGETRGMSRDLRRKNADAGLLPVEREPKAKASVAEVHSALGTLDVYGTRTRTICRAAFAGPLLPEFSAYLAAYMADEKKPTAGLVALAPKIGAYNDDGTPKADEPAPEAAPAPVAETKEPTDAAPAPEPAKERTPADVLADLDRLMDEAVRLGCFAEIAARMNDRAAAREAAAEAHKARKAERKRSRAESINRETAAPAS